MKNFSSKKIKSLVSKTCVFVIVLVSVQADWINQANSRIKKQKIEEHHDEDLKSRNGSPKAFRLATAPAYYGHQSVEHVRPIGTSRKRRESSPNDWSTQSVGSDYVAINSSAQASRKALSGDLKDYWLSERKILNHVFVEYNSETDKSYPKKNVVEYSIKVKFNREYILEKRVAVKEEGGRYIKEERHGKGCLDENTFKALRSKVYEFLSNSSGRFPSAMEVEPRGPAKSSTLKVRPSPTEEQLVFRSHIGANPEYYPTEFLDLIRKLNSIVYSKID